MISTLFKQGSELIEVRISDTNCLFRTADTQGGFVTIDGIKLQKDGCIKEHPDLKENKEWKKESIKRFKKKIKTLDSEKKRMRYIMEDLSKHGYTPLYFQQSGHRAIKIK